MQRGDGDEVGFVIFRDCEEGVTNLFDVNGSRERGFLGIVAFQLEEAQASVRERQKDGGRRYPDAMFVVPYTISCDRWMVAFTQISYVQALRVIVRT